MAQAFSIEDKNLDVSPINISRTKLYKDIDLTFTARPNGEIYKKTEAASVKQAVKNLILTNYYEKPFLPRYGGNLRFMLFELADEDTAEEIEEACKSVINRYEPRAQVLDVEANVGLENNNVNVKIEFRVINTKEVVVFTTTLERLR